MPQISKIAMFLAVVKHQSFAGAARELGFTGPALSKQVQALEDQLGVRLLHRTTRQVNLTEEGAIYYERARKALEDLDEAERQIQDLKASPTGLLKVNGPMSFGTKYLTKPITAFAQDYPNVTLNVDFNDRQVDMIEEGYDVVIRIGALEDSSLIARKLAECPIIMCASPDYIEQYGLPGHPEELTDYPAILFDRHGGDQDWQYADQKGVSGRVKMTPVMRANNAEMMLEGCLEGLGIAILPIFSVAEYLEKGALIHLLPAYQTEPERAIYALFPQNRHLSTKTRLFVDHLSGYCKSLPW